MQLERFKIRALAGVVALMVLSGCAATPMTTQIMASPPQGLPASAELTDVPFFAQAQYLCGPAALATVLNTTGLKTEPNALAKSVYTPGREGTLQTEIITGTRRQGRLALPIRNLSEMFVNVAQGRPALILQNLGLEIAPQWHYAVVVGYDLPNETVLLRSGTTLRKVMPMETFEHTWRRSGHWGVVVVGPDGPVPNNTTLAEWLQEANGIDRAGRPQDAFAAFDSAARHWPDASAPLVSAANILIKTNRLQDAKILLLAAQQREPENPVALNNLAHVLMQLGDLDEAERIALKAVEIGGKTQDMARETLMEIQARHYSAQR